MCLGRGGDQAALRSKDGYEFFGGVSKGVEKRTKVKARIVASALQELIDNPAGVDSESVGKLITSNTWYFAANLPRAAADRLEEGDSAALRFSGELNRDVEMTVDRIGATEGEVTLVVFSCGRYLTLTTLLRHQTAELIFESWNGLRVPKEALRLEEVPAETPGEGSASSQAEPCRTPTPPPARRRPR